MFKLIRAALWGTEVTEATEEDFDEMRLHAILGLVGPILSKVKMSPKLREKWQKTIFQQYIYNMHCFDVQSSISLTVPYVVIKGTSAAQYYPYPEFRTMGDIDIMTRREDYQAACQMLVQSGCKEITTESHKEIGRHREFIMRDISIEVHSYFSWMNDPVKAKALDEYIYNNISDTHVLPDLINGLVLIEHINQHMEEGLGLRQIIDWMMFVDKCLPDEKWEEFQKLVIDTGLERLAIVTTKMCEMYLGLPKHKWCEKADRSLCIKLMEYILKCGNFGNKRSIKDRLASGRINRSLTPISILASMQRKGLEEWRLSRIRLLKPFAWLWKSFQILKGSKPHLKDYINAKKQSKLLNSLGVKRDILGVAVYKDGKYSKQEILK